MTTLLKGVFNPKLLRPGFNFYSSVNYPFLVTFINISRNYCIIIDYTSNIWTFIFCVLSTPGTIYFVHFYHYD